MASPANTTVALEGSPTALDGIYSKVSRRIVPVLLVSYIVAYLDRVNVGFAKLQMLQDLHFSETVYGLGAGLFFIGYFLFEVPSNAVLHRVGARKWIARIMITWGLLSAAMMFVTTPAMFYALRLVLGAAEAGFFPGVIFYFTQWYPAKRRGRITALFMTGVALSSIVGSVLSGWILQAFEGVNGWKGWQWLFLLEGAPAVALGVYVLVRLTDNIARADWLSAQEKVALTEDLARDAQQGEQRRSFGSAFRDARVWFACLVYFCLVIGLYGIGFWLPTIIANLASMNPLQVGLLTAMPYTMAAICMVLVGRSADKTGERRWHVAVPAAAGACGMLLSVLFARDAIGAILALTLATSGVLTAPPLFWSLPTTYLRGAAAAAGIAIINSFGNLAGFVSPYVIGWIRDATGSFAVGMYFLASFTFLGGLLVIVGVPRQRQP